MSHPITGLFAIEVIDHADGDRCQVVTVPNTEGEADAFLKVFNVFCRVGMEARKRPVLVSWEFAD